MMAQEADSPTLLQIITAAGGRPEVREAVAGLYLEIQQAVEQRQPICLMSGRCCRFEEYGHRLFVTTLELACFHHDLLGLRQAGRSKPNDAWDGTGCPFQAGKLCSVHTIRPMGCRLYFCDATAQQWQQELYERCHTKLRHLHDELHVPYRYMEWRAALREAELVNA